MTTEIGPEMLPLLRQLMAVLETVNDVVTQQKAIELLMAQHARRMPKLHRSFTIDSMAKHAKQMLGSL